MRKLDCSVRWAVAEAIRFSFQIFIKIVSLFRDLLSILQKSSFEIILRLIWSPSFGFDWSLFAVPVDIKIAAKMFNKINTLHMSMIYQSWTRIKNEKENNHYEDRLDMLGQIYEKKRDQMTATLVSLFLTASWMCFNDFLYPQKCDRQKVFSLPQKV